MLGRISAALAAVFLLAGPALAGTVSSSTINVTESGGAVRTRDFKYYTPTGLQTGRPLVIVLHGGGSNADKAIGDAIEYEGLWNGRADSGQFYVLYPQGKPQPGVGDKRNWNDCRAAATAFDGNGEPTDGGMDPAADNYSDWDDVTFINDLVDHFISPPGGSGIQAVDPNKIFVLGLSNGGLMTQRLAIESPAAFKGFATSVAMLPQKNECAAPNTTTLRASGRKMLFLYGTADQYMPAGGGPIHNDPSSGSVLSATATVSQWNTWWGVSASGTEVQQPDVVNEPNPSTQHWTYHCDSTPCPTGTAANMGDTKIRNFVARVLNGGHNVPGVANMPLIYALLGLGPRNRDAIHVDTIRSFFGF